MEQANNIDKEQPPASPRIVPPFVVADAFRTEFLDAVFCTRWLLEKLYQGSPQCPECGEEITDTRQLERFYTLQKISCQNCGSRPTAKKGTILENCSLTPRQYILLAVSLEKGLTTTETTHLVGISDESVRQWREKLSA